MSPRRLSWILTAITLLALCAFAAYASALIFFTPIAWCGPSDAHCSDKTLKIYQGESLRSLAFRLKQAGALQHPWALEWYGRLRGDSAKLKHGEYRIGVDESINQLLTRIVAGDVLVREFQIIEGWTFSQVKAALLRDTHLKHMLDILSDQDLMKKLGSIHDSPEGMLFPDTYAYVWGDSDFDVIARAYYRMQKELREQWQQRAQGLPYESAYQALIVASMIEKETAIDRERPMIAGVIIRRLEKRMRLQIDPTVVYGMGKPYGTVLTRTNLRTDTPYNTYTRKGLPPTPIDMPSLASIRAALHPADGTALFYVARDDGSHQFSDTYEQHKQAVQRYQR